MRQKLFEDVPYWFFATFECLLQLFGRGFNVKAIIDRKDVFLFQISSKGFTKKRKELCAHFYAARLILLNLIP